MTRERIEDIREIVMPFVSKRLMEANYENLGESDAKEFERDFNEIINLANKALGQAELVGNSEELQEPKTNWIPCSVRTPETDDLYYVTEKIDDNIGCTTEEWRDGRWVNLAEWEKVIAWLSIPDAYQESEE